MSELIPVQTSTQDKYNIHTGLQLMPELEKFVEQFPSRSAIVMVDAFVLEHHRHYFEPALSSHFKRLHVFEVPRGEKAKSFEVYKQAVDFVLEKGVERSTPLIAIGGGVTGDLSGFVAATVLRGLPLIHVPTTLLAMVDSSIGGKTGINHQVGKNLVGSFYQPRAVFADGTFLSTLSRKEWVNGLSEVLKYGMIRHPEMLDDIALLLESNRFTEAEAWLPLIRKSAQTKTDIVAEDVLESGKRAFLNFGHTYAHVIEREGGYQRYSHGEAVFAGMIAAVEASNALGASINPTNLLKFKPLYELSLDEITSSPAELTEIMRKDKKVKDNQIRLILLEKMGTPYIHEVNDTELVEQSWQNMLNVFR
ncbi:3-dehydroquinate synthase [Gracilimonas mengyeensis]|uniref:3-dehydroquinate synthase n=1 Tax=Gracilimonas mengyeensis TaxID=1302730 RepID=A0A521C504_9BACT|nr:3-dehydroquinate synthase [Gracilimonas mengyeensis]SMO54498.1 3-dehydroquinate synthase [Gracilimonas mengyeensis]